MDAKRRTVLLERLEAAEDAQHGLIVGTRAKVFVDQNGERVEFDSMSATAIAKYIFTLKLQLGLDVSGPAQPWM